MKLHVDFYAGEIVEVLSEAQILSTLDSEGAFQGLLFAPEMNKFCGKRLRVLRRLNNIMIEGVGIRRIRDAVILNGAVCDGKNHAGCGRMCHLVWKTKWLKSVDSPSTTNRKMASSKRTGADVISFSRIKALPCQATSLLRASSPPDKMIIRQYLLSISPGVFRSIEIFRRSLIALRTHGLKLLQKKNETIVTGENIRTPTASLSLKPGEFVEVKSKEEIILTLDKKGRNRGLLLSPEMLQYCGKRFRVLKRVDSAINEATGELRQVANTIILEGVMCNGEAHGYCQRRCPCLWREIWLRRAPATKD